MGECLDRTSHPCGTDRGLVVFERDDGGVDGYCYNCNTYVRHPYGHEVDSSDLPKKNKRLKRTKEEVLKFFQELSEYPSCDLVDRRLRKADLDYYNVKIGVSQEDGSTPILHYYPYSSSGELCRYKIRLIKDKRIWTEGFNNDVDLFGWEQAISKGVKRLIITEGELDAVALNKILVMHTKEDFKESIPAVCSLPNGAGSAKRDLGRLSSKIRKHFKEISFCFDNDEAGRKAIEDSCVIFPEATVITLPEKDANDCVIKGKTKAAFSATIFNAAKPKNSRLVWVDDVWDKAKEPPELGVSWPWENVTRLTRGIRKGETIYIGGPPKMGKSELVNSIAEHLVVKHHWKVLLAKPEESNVKSVKLLAGKVVSKRFHDPNVSFDEAAYERAGKELLGKKICLINLYQHLGWETLKQDITSAASEGIDAVFIDPITNLTNGMSSGDANTKLQEISQELSAMALDLNIVIFIFCHLRNPESGIPHERGGKVLTSQFAGSRAMGRSCNYMFGLEGNKDAELPEEERNIRRLVLLDDREFGEVGVTTLFWDKITTQFNEIK